MCDLCIIIFLVMSTIFSFLCIRRTPPHRRWFSYVHFVPEPLVTSAVDVELICKICITTRLKDATQLERPRDIFRAEEEIAHLHGVAHYPVGDDAGPETLAGFCGVVF